MSDRMQCALMSAGLGWASLFFASVVFDNEPMREVLFDALGYAAVGGLAAASAVLALAAIKGGD